MLSKNDHIVYCLSLACIELMNQDKTEYTGETDKLRNDFMVKLSMTHSMYHNRINQATYKWYKKVIKAFDSEIKVGDGWIPLLLCNEVMAAWLTERSKHLKFWDTFDFTAVYDHMDSVPDGLGDTMINKAQNVLHRITGEKHNRAKAERLLKLKAIRLRLQNATD